MEHVIPKMYFRTCIKTNKISRIICSWCDLQIKIGGMYFVCDDLHYCYVCYDTLPHEV